MRSRATNPMACGVLPLLLFSAGIGFAADAGGPVELKDGAFCQEQNVEPFEGETHRCYFSPRRHGERDFSKRNGRAQYVATVLGPVCREIEILGDGPSERVSTDGTELAQLSVHCSD
jgi:hypothetical protein